MDSPNRPPACRKTPSPLMASLLLACALLAGCAAPISIPPGTSLIQTQAQLGQPNYTCQRDNGLQRVIWTQQPFGQFAWGTNVNADGSIEGIEALLTDQNFRKLGQGVWTPEQVLCEFGPPAEKGGVGLPSSVQIVWSYRYQQDGVWNSLMYVYFGTDGKQVTRFHPGPDPMYEERYWPAFF